MYKVTTIFERPSDDIQYYLSTQQELRIEFAKFISEVPELLLMNVIDESSLKQISEAFFPDEESFNIFTTKFNEKFPTFFDDRNVYHQLVNIITSRVAESI